MKNKKITPETEPQRLSYVETPLLTGQYPAFGIEHGNSMPDAERQEKKKRKA